MSMWTRALPKMNNDSLNIISRKVIYLYIKHVAAKMHTFKITQTGQVADGGPSEYLKGLFLWNKTLIADSMHNRKRQDIKYLDFHNLSGLRQEGALQIKAIS